MAVAFKNPLTSREQQREPSWQADPEIALMLRVQRGDASAFQELQGRYHSRVFGYFVKQLRDRADAEDFTQEVFLRLYRSRERYQPRARLATWIFHITQNVARNAIRSRRRHPTVRFASNPAENGATMDSQLMDRAETPCRPLERSEIRHVVRAAVSGLMGRQREALELHQFQDHTYAEVAKVLQMSPKAAKSLLYRARNQLREVLAEYMS
jgi:RNA polymerase sigma-70 factor (ECF subfamily)